MVLVTAALLSSSVMSLAAAQPADNKRKEIVKVSLIAHDTAVKPGDTVHLGIVFDIAKDWHIYWPGQNDSGMPTSIEWTFPAGSGLTAGEPAFPLPTRHVESGGISLNYILEKKVVLTVPVKVPATAARGSSFKINAKVSYLVCNEACQPGEADVSTTITIADKTAVSPENAKVIDDARAAQPKAQTDGFNEVATASWAPPAKGTADPKEPRTLVIQAKDALASEVTFYPAEGAAKLLDPIRSGQAKGHTLRLKFEPGPKAAEGVVAIKTGNTVKAWSFRSPETNPAEGGGAPADPARPSR